MGKGLGLLRSLLHRFLQLIRFRHRGAVIVVKVGVKQQSCLLLFLWRQSQLQEVVVALRGHLPELVQHRGVFFKEHVYLLQLGSRWEHALCRGPQEVGVSPAKACHCSHNDELQA